MKFVTSLSPHRIERQQYCLETWRKHGLPIVAVQTPGEAGELGRHFTGVEFVETAITGDNVGKPRCPRVSEMCKLAADEPILLLNSDISVKDSPGQFASQWLEERSPHELVVGIRRDFDRVGGPKVLNAYGIDAFRIVPQMMPYLSDIGFCIGFPGWDYWIPWELHIHGYRMRVAESSLLHVVHDLGYSRDDIGRAQTMLQNYYSMPKVVFTLFVQYATGRTGRTRRRTKRLLK